MNIDIIGMFLIGMIVFSLLGILSAELMTRYDERKQEEYRRMIYLEIMEERIRRQRQAQMESILANAMKKYEAPRKMMTWNEFLGVPPNATKDEINRAYREKAKTMHPDRGGSEKKMASLNRAREIGLRIAK